MFALLYLYATSYLYALLYATRNIRRNFNEDMELHISSTASDNFFFCKKLDVPGPLPGGDHLLVDSRKRPQTRRISGGRLKEVSLCFDKYALIYISNLCK